MSKSDGISSASTAAFAATRAAVEADLRTIVRLHAAAFPGFFLTNLGSPFLRAYYRMVLRYEGGILLVAEDGEGLTGFVAGFVDPHEFYARMKARKWRLLIPVLLGLMTRPDLLPRVVGNVNRVRRTAAVVPPAGDHVCELSSLAVVPDRMRRGIGRALVAAFIAAAECKRACRVVLTTDAEGNEAVRRFYENLGFRQSRRFESVGKRPMLEYAVTIPRQFPEETTDPC